jgi:hypothetical protein
MQQLAFTEHGSPSELAEATNDWDELWSRSATNSPLARPALVAHWADHFSRRTLLRAIEIRRDGNLMAVLPLIGKRYAKLFPLGCLPSNAWASCGDLLLDPTADAEVILGELVRAIDRLPWPIIQLSPLAVTAPWWQAFRLACGRYGLEMMPSLVGSVGQVEIEADWQGYRSRWSKNHRRHIEKAGRRARLAGRLTLDVHTELLPEDIERWLRVGFEIEDRSWKGEAATSVLRTPGMFNFYLEQARQLARWGQLQLTFLLHDNRPIAFEYGYRAKGTYFSHKVGYDPAYAHFSPGQLLRALLLQRFHEEAQLSLVDFCGPLTEATAKWSTRSYPVGKWLIAPRRVLSRYVLRGRAAWRGLLRRSRPAA